MTDADEKNSLTSNRKKGHFERVIHLAKPLTKLIDEEKEEKPAENTPNRKLRKNQLKNNKGTTKKQSTSPS